MPREPEGLARGHTARSDRPGSCPVCLPLQQDFVLIGLGQNSAERGEGRRQWGTARAETGWWGGAESRETGPAGWCVTWGVENRWVAAKRVCLKVRSLPWILLIGSELLPSIRKPLWLSSWLYSNQMQNFVFSQILRVGFLILWPCFLLLSFPWKLYVKK